ncbi:MAG: aminotransferase class V-fold PLP-dependent enzyme [Bacteroidota bacterium]
MLTCQHHLFDIPENINYLNGAYMSPQLKSISKIGQAAVLRKSQPFHFSIDDFFQPTEQLKALFAQLIEAENSQRIAIIPSVSYGISTVAKNVQLSNNQHILLVDEQFPSNYYPWKNAADQADATLKMIAPPSTSNRTKNWNEAILNAINADTAIVALGHIHWADGTLFDLKAIRAKTKEAGALLIIDGTQSVGALPFSVKEFEPDALVCGGYKWLLGPYSLGLAYYGEAFDDGSPLEENWINRDQSEDFAGLVSYKDQYRPFAARYSMGEQSNFVLVPMLIKALEQLLEWGVDNVQSYAKNLSKATVEVLKDHGCRIEEEAFRCGHLFGVRLPKQLDMNELKTTFARHNVFVSIRGDSIRISPNVYNTAQNFEQLVKCFE